MSPRTIIGGEIVELPEGEEPAPEPAPEEEPKPEEEPEEEPRGHARKRR